LTNDCKYVRNQVEPHHVKLGATVPNFNHIISLEQWYIRLGRNDTLVPHMKHVFSCIQLLLLCTGKETKEKIIGLRLVTRIVCPGMPQDIKLYKKLYQGARTCRGEANGATAPGIQ